MTLSTSSGWVALALVPLAALTGCVMRRVKLARHAVRMRPHYVIGYGSAAVATLHLATSAADLPAADASGIRLATFAFAAMLLQTFVGASLQAPGAYRGVLRRWHTATFVIVTGLVALHVALNGPLTGMAIGVASSR